MHTANVTELDASTLLGSGQTVRLALGLSSILQRPILLKNIRANRDNPGLKEHHLASAKLMAKITNAVMDGDYVGSVELLFIPKKITGGAYSIELSNSGNSVNVLQSVMLPAMFASGETTIIINGGMFFPWIHFSSCVTTILRRLGLGFTYFIGSNSMGVRMKPVCELKPLHLSDRRDLGETLTFVAGNSCSLILKSLSEPLSRYDFLIEVDEKTSVTKLFKFEGAIMGFDGVIGTGKEETSIDEIDNRAKRELDSGAMVDTKTAEQILPFLALSDDFSIKVYDVTEHIETAIWLIAEMTHRDLIISKNPFSKSISYKGARLCL